MDPKFFKTPSDWRKWLELNHDRLQELWVGFYKRDSGKPSITWPESVDGALCFGWIDGVRKSIDATSYKIRFTPRRPGSIWSAINIKRVAELTKLGLMHAAGLKVFRERDPKKSGRYSFEQKPQQLDPAYEKELRANKRAWTFFQAQPPWYRRTCSFYVMSAKQEETRRRRLARLIQDSEHERPISPLLRTKKRV
jgi:uncharacterized protein YdeI (YjbR/CyaY-like superfamily)